MDVACIAGKVDSWYVRNAKNGRKVCRLGPPGTPTQAFRGGVAVTRLMAYVLWQVEMYVNRFILSIFSTYIKGQ